MIINCKIELTDEQRNTLYRRISGKNVKRLISRKEVCELLQDFIDEMLRFGSSSILAGSTDETGTPTELVDQPASVSLQVDDDDIHAECIKQNSLLNSRCNILQNRLDKLHAQTRS